MPADPKSLWQNQEMEVPVMSLAEIRAKAAAQAAKIRRGNIRESIGSLFVIAIFGWYAYIFPGWMMKAGSALIILAVLFVMRARLKRVRTMKTVLDGEARTVVESYRAALGSRRDAHATAWRWAMLPMAPGMALIILGRWFEFHVPDRDLGMDRIIILLTSIIIALIFIGMGLWHALKASRLQKEIDDLDRSKVSL